MYFSYKRVFVCAILAACILFASGASVAQQTEGVEVQESDPLNRVDNIPQTNELVNIRERIEEQEQLINQQKQFLDQQQRKIESLKQKINQIHQTPGPNRDESKGVQSSEGGSADYFQHPVGQEPPSRVDRLKEAADVIQEQAILTHKGTLIIEPSLNYSYSSVHRVALEGFTIIPAITIGLIEVRNVDRNTVIGALSLRYGITNRLEAGVKIPYVNRRDTTISRPLAIAAEEDSVTKATGKGIGDLEVNLNYMFNDVVDGGPYYVGSLRLKSRNGRDPFEAEVDQVTGLQTSLPTGSGFRSIQPGISISYPSDPAVFFGSLSYQKNIGREINPTIGKIDPGDAVGVSFGMAFAINRKASFSLGYNHNSVAETKQNGVPLTGSGRLEVGTLLIGLSHRLEKNRSLNISLGAGLTEDAPDVQLSFRLPMSFSIAGS